MLSFADRLRRWYDYERDCNARCLDMLESVPSERRGDSQFQKAVDRLAHLVAARRRWLSRLGRLAEAPPAFRQGVDLAALKGQIADTESAWVAYLATIDDAELSRVATWEGADGGRRQWDVSEILTQLFGHAWYHRGQIAQLVAALGGAAVDTDFFWCGVPPRRVRK
jgi:uncharacterized damage-inducible protein DinB